MGVLTRDICNFTHGKLKIGNCPGGAGYNQPVYCFNTNFGQNGGILGNWTISLIEKCVLKYNSTKMYICKSHIYHRNCQSLFEHDIWI